MLRNFGLMLCCSILTVGAAITADRLPSRAAQISIWIAVFLLMSSIGALL